jgi:antitoxin HigA-1
MPELFVPSNRRPTMPGEMLVEEFLSPLSISQLKFAEQIGVTYPRLNEIVNGKRAVSVDTAMRFAKALGTTPQFWMNLQTVVDIYDAQHGPAAKVIDKIKRIPIDLAVSNKAFANAVAEGAVRIAGHAVAGSARVPRRKAVGERKPRR